MLETKGLNRVAFWYSAKLNKDGKKDGLGTWWYDSGQKQSEASFKDGKVVD